MTPPVRPEIDPAKLDAAVKALKAQGAPDEAIHAYLQQQGLKPVEEAPKEGLATRVAENIAGGITSLLHPIETGKAILQAPVKSLITAMSPGVGEPRHSAALSKGGNSSGRPIDTTPYDAAHGGVTGKERLAGTAQAVTNIALPGIAGGVASKLGGGAIARALGLAAAGGASGAAYSPDDPAAGGIAGAVMAPTLAAAGKGAGRIAGKAGSTIVDLAGRPMESQPIQAGPVTVGHIEGLTDRAARLNAQGLDRPGFFSAAKPDFVPNDKPIAPVDMHIAAQRMARGLKTSSAGAETVLRGALEPRGEGAVDRVISHGLEATGLKTRESGLATVDDLIAQRTQHGNENFQPVFAKYPNPLTDKAGGPVPELAAILKTPAGQQALKRGMTIAANRGEDVAKMPMGGGVPDGYSPEQWAQITGRMQERGMHLPVVPSGETVVAPTLKQAHYIKLGFDDMLNSAPEPGSGGSGPNNAAAIRALKNRWLETLDKTAPEYGQARKVFADESDLIRAAETGRSLFTMHPDEAAKAFREMSDAERQVARRTGFDALAERIENGPADVSKGASKPRDQKRMRLLFPDDQSFADFQEGLKQEAQMHATKQGVLGGSNTADKLADMAGMAGVSIPDVFKAMKGNPIPLITRGAKAIMAPRLRANADALSTERAKLLVAGAEGSGGARNLAIQKMAAQRPSGPPPKIAPPINRGSFTLPEVLDSRKGPDITPPSLAAQAIRRQVDDMNRDATVRAHKGKPPIRRKR